MQVVEDILNGVMRPEEVRSWKIEAAFALYRPRVLGYEVKMSGVYELSHVMLLLETL